MKPGLHIKYDKLKQVFNGLNLLLSADVLVGYPADGDQKAGTGGPNTRKPDPDDKAPLTNAEIAYIMENGAPEANIPPRPSLLPGIEAARPRITALFKQHAQYCIKGDIARADRVLHAIGLTAQAAVRSEITNGNFLPLSPRTLAERLRRGRTGTKPLLDTGQMRNAVNYVIRKSITRRVRAERIVRK